MSTFELTVSTPGGNAYRAPAQRIILRGTAGDLAVMAGHVPFVTAVRPGECRIVKEDGEEISGVSSGGLLTVTADRVTLISGSFEMN